MCPTIKGNLFQEENFEKKRRTKIVALFRVEKHLAEKRKNGREPLFLKKNVKLMEGRIKENRFPRKVREEEAALGLSRRRKEERGFL